ncbi:phosphatase PAP2 family protein [Chitinophaga lutea]
MEISVCDTANLKKPICKVRVEKEKAGRGHFDSGSRIAEAYARTPPPAEIFKRCSLRATFFIIFAPNKVPYMAWILRPVVLFVLIAGIAQQAQAQSDSTLPSRKEKIYNVNWKVELPVGVAALCISPFGFQALDRTSMFDKEDALALNPADINAFDRPGAFTDPAKFTISQHRSDLFLNISVLSPLVLALDKRVRKDWLDLISMYLVAHTFDNAVYFAAAFPIRRARPYIYNPEVPLDAKVGIAKSNSFFSGHVSFAATSTFFLAKVYTDYHGIKGWKRVGLFAAAAVPPSLVGVYRMRAGKHFRTDVLTGLLVGGASGILVPELHRNLRKHKQLSLSPYYSGEGSGVAVTIKL